MVSRPGTLGFAFYKTCHSGPINNDKQKKLQTQHCIHVYKSSTLDELLRWACMERRGAGRSRSVSVRPVTRAMLFFLFMSMSSTMSPTTLLHEQAQTVMLSVDKLHVDVVPHYTIM